jgi:hypothetical protein
MKSRIEYAQVAPGVVGVRRALENYVRVCRTESKLLELIKIRVSQINGRNRLAAGFRSVPSAYQPAKHRDQNPAQFHRKARLC